MGPRAQQVINDVQETDSCGESPQGLRGSWEAGGHTPGQGLGADLYFPDPLTNSYLQAAAQRSLEGGRASPVLLGGSGPRGSR